ncbi:MAG: hypothetical protein ED557_05985 [Balneola sp.]|nr:MAG: hypothetical protein ED557_05985 [Balneola sp.]
MSQAFLSLGAVTIFMFLSVNILRSYVNAAHQTVNSQQEIDAINFGISITDELYSQSFNYDSLETNYGNLNDIRFESTRKNYITTTQDTLAATISLSEEREILIGSHGRVATITIYRIEDGTASELATQYASIVPYNSN